VISSSNSTTAFSPSLSSQGRTSVQHSFTIVEDMCLESGLGMTIYQNTKTLPSQWLSYRHGVGKRIANGLLTRRMIEKR
jgi:hypothetical protein